MQKLSLIFSLFFLLSIIQQAQAQYLPSNPRFRGLPAVPLPRFPQQRRQYHRIPLGGNVVGPESIAFDCQGSGPYVGVSNGKILKWQGDSIGWTVFAKTNPNRKDSCDNDSPDEPSCGRPLGLKFNMATCDLYVADSSLGLVRVSRNGKDVTSVATGIDGVPFMFLNALDIDSESGDIYFTDTSTRHHRWEFQLISRSDQSGRLMKYNPKTKHVSVLLKDLYFANGVALSKNKDYILVTETTTNRVLRYWLAGPKVGNVELFMQLSGRPDNINRNPNGDFWIAQNPIKPIKVDESGKILDILDAISIADASDVTEFNNTLWVGSVIQNYVVYTS